MDLRQSAQAIFATALAAVDARAAVVNNLRLRGNDLTISDLSLDLARYRGVYLIAIGKAAVKMATGIQQVLGGRLNRGVVVGPRGTDSPPTRIQQPGGTALQWLEGGHPVPDGSSMEAAQAVFELLEHANADHSLILFAISGGGSALLEWPNDESITLEDIQTANKLLISCGATIDEINSVRRCFSAVKGGGLARRAPACDQVTLIISDTNPGDQINVASGPTFEDYPADEDAKSVVERYETLKQLPRSILLAVHNRSRVPQITSTDHLRRHYVLLDNTSALEAVAREARARGFYTDVAVDIIEQPIDEGCTALLSRLGELSAQQSRPVCLISGGEFKCPVLGNGIGGRNLETVLRSALDINQTPLRQMGFVILSAGTDGIDGNSTVAGAIADATTLTRAKRLDLNPQRYLDASDAFNFFDALGDTIVTGPTGTNVRDVRIMLIHGAQAL